jgi:hypothetical protein
MIGANSPQERAMHSGLFSLVAGCVLVAVARPVSAQRGGIKLSDVAGTWEGKSMMGPKDTVITTWVVTASADSKAWTYKRAGLEAKPMRILAMGGDSIVTAVGPLPSVLRPGQTVTVVRTVGHYKGNQMTGTFEAHYASGGVVRGTVAATRKK